MTTGIMMIVFGRKCERLALETIPYSRRYTGLPFHVITNLGETERSERWRNINNLSFQYEAMSDEDNREIKLRVGLYSPFDKAFFMDADCMVQNPGIEKLAIPGDGLLLHKDRVYRKGGKIARIYKRAVDTFDLSEPFTIWHDCFYGFDAGSEQIKELYELKYQLWEQFGKGRDMPAVNAAIQKSPHVPITEIGDDILAAQRPSRKAVVQHHYGKDKFYIDLGLDPDVDLPSPPVPEKKPFEKVLWK